MEYPKSFEELMTCFKMLPGIGNKGAERMAYAIYDMSEEDVKRFSQALTSFKENVHTCPICGNLSEGDKCEICSDHERDQSTICVVESPKDVFAMAGTDDLSRCLALACQEISYRNQGTRTDQRGKAAGERKGIYVYRQRVGCQVFPGYPSE